MAYRLSAIGKVLTAVIVAIGLLETRAEAIAVLTFDQTVDGGTVAYGGGAGAATGTTIAFDILIATATPLNAGTYGCSACELNFTTGANTSNAATGPGVRAYTWAGGGSFVLTGTVFDPSDLSVIASGTLLSGTFTGAQGITIALGGAANDIINFTAQGTDTKHEDLADFFGTGPSFIYSNFEGSGEGTVGVGGSFSGAVNEADLINTELTIPEPASALLLLMGLASLAAYRRNRG